MIGEVCFACRIQTRNRGHQLVIDPQATHGVVRCWVNAHRCLVRVFTCNALVHLEQVAVALFHNITTKSINCCREIEVDSIFQWSNSLTLVNQSFCCTRRNIARGQVAIRRIQALKEVIALSLRNLICLTIVVCTLRNPYSPVIAQRLAHECEF